VAPAASWYLFVQLHRAPADPGILSPVLFGGIFNRILHPFPYHFGGFIRFLACALDLLALAGIVAALIRAFYRAFRRAWIPAAVALFAFVALAIATSNPGVWSEV